MSPAPTSAPVLIGGGNGVIVSYRDSNHTYALHGAPPAPDADLEAFHRNGAWCPSVTGILGVLDKSALKGWAANCAVRGFAQLVKHGKGTYRLPEGKGDTFEIISADLKRIGAHYWQQSGAAAQRGLDVHAIAQAWIEDGTVPTRGDFPPDRWPYVQALGKFIMERKPEFLTTETIVGSAKHGFAGRLDTTARMRLAERGTGLLDFKTSKRVYPKQMFRQLGGYDLAGIECGCDPTDFQGIVRLGADGEYELSVAPFKPTELHTMFLNTLRTWRDDRALEPPKRRR